MEMQVQLFLPTCIVYFTMISIQPHHQMVDQAVLSQVNYGGGRIRENFRNLFDSIAKNDIEKSKIYQGILKQEEMKEQQALETMKEELWIAQNRNSYKTRNFHKENNVGENVIATKRQIENKNDTGTFFALPGIEVPKSTDIQVLAEALWFNNQDRCPFVKDFKHKKLKAVDVCELSKQEAMKYCLKLESVYNLTEGNYSLIPGGKVEECKPYNIIFYHAGPEATLDKVRARKCPFQPDELFITKGNKRISVFVLTWTNAQRKYLLLDHYMDDDDDDIENRWPMNCSSALKKPVRFNPWF